MQTIVKEKRLKYIDRLKQLFIFFKDYGQLAKNNVATLVKIRDEYDAWNKEFDVLDQISIAIYDKTPGAYNYGVKMFLRFARLMIDSVQALEENQKENFEKFSWLFASFTHSEAPDLFTKFLLECEADLTDDVLKASYLWESLTYLVATEPNLDFDEWKENKTKDLSHLITVLRGGKLQILSIEGEAPQEKLLAIARQNVLDFLSLGISTQEKFYKLLNFCNMTWDNFNEPVFVDQVFQIEEELKKGKRFLDKIDLLDKGQELQVASLSKNDLDGSCIEEESKKEIPSGYITPPKNPVESLATDHLAIFNRLTIPNKPIKDLVTEIDNHVLPRTYFIFPTYFRDYAITFVSNKVEIGFGMDLFFHNDQQVIIAKLQTLLLHELFHAKRFTFQKKKLVYPNTPKLAKKILCKKGGGKIETGEFMEDCLYEGHLSPGYFEIEANDNEDTRKRKEELFQLVINLKEADDSKINKIRELVSKLAKESDDSPDLPLRKKKTCYKKFSKGKRPKYFLEEDENPDYYAQYFTNDE